MIASFRSISAFLRLYTSGSRSISKVRRLLTSPASDERDEGRPFTRTMQTRSIRADRFTATAGCARRIHHFEHHVERRASRHFRAVIERYSFSPFLPWHPTRISVERENYLPSLARTVTRSEKPHRVFGVIGSFRVRSRCSICRNCDEIAARTLLLARFFLAREIICSLAACSSILNLRDITSGINRR